MSKSYSKYKSVGICTGRNTEFYRDRRRLFRTRDKQMIRNILAHAHVDEFDELYTPENIPFKDNWEEPTDGTIRITANDAKRDNYRGIYATKNGKIKK